MRMSSSHSEPRMRLSIFWLARRTTTIRARTELPVTKETLSPRHADVLMVTGPVTRNMREALRRTYDATPDPKWVVAVGDCAVDGGVFAGSYAVVGSVSAVVPVDLHIRGCPPRPVQLLAGLLALLEDQSRR